MSKRTNLRILFDIEEAKAFERTTKFYQKIQLVILIMKS
jgi:hypothetical protein